MSLSGTISETDGDFSQKSQNFPTACFPTQTLLVCVIRKHILHAKFGMVAQARRSMLQGSIGYLCLCYKKTYLLMSKSQNFPTALVISVKNRKIFPPLLYFMLQLKEVNAPNFSLSDVGQFQLFQVQYRGKY